jgi:serine protease Do
MHRLRLPMKESRPLAACLVVAFLSAWVQTGRADQPDAGAARRSLLSDPAVLELGRFSEGMAKVAEAVRPSVVSIRSLAVSDAVNDELRRMTGDEDFQPIPLTGTGSGVILDVQGHIVTNNHVVEDADAVRVTLDDGREFRAEVVGTDPKTDLAVIRINAAGLTPAELGDSDAVRVGHLILAIGSPFRFGHSISHGIISARGRSEVDVEIDYKNWLQTDAPINPGNSGGPLINTRGEVIGISVAIATESGGYQGVGFAIPSNTVRYVTDLLRAGRPIVRGYLGVSIYPVDTDVASAYGLANVGGVLIEGVKRGAPAAKAGLMPEDIVLKVDGQPIRDREQLQSIVAAKSPGTVSSFEVWRKRQPVQVSIEMGTQPDGFSTSGNLDDLMNWPEDAVEDPESARRAASPAEYEFTEAGFEVANLTPKLARDLRFEDGAHAGVVVTRVDPLGRAFAAGLQRGVIIVVANDRRIRTVNDLLEVVTPQALSQGVRLRIRLLRGDRQIERSCVIRVR